MSVKTMKTMVKWVEDNIMNQPSLEQMSDYVGYSSFYCSSKFHEYVGISFKEYVIGRKLCLAAMELKETKKNIIEIALDFGFSSHEAFTRAFTKVYGYTPKQYRKLTHEIPLF